VKKVLACTSLGIALLAARSAASAVEPRHTDPRSRVHLERPLPLNLARAFAMRMFEEMTVPNPPTPEPSKRPATNPRPAGDSDDICNPERVHCPIG